MKKTLKVLVIPGGGLRLSQQRVQEALNMNLTEKIDIIIFSGGNNAKTENGGSSTEAYIMCSEYKKLTNDSKKVLLIKEERSRDTYENITYSVQSLCKYLYSKHSCSTELSKVYDSVTLIIATDKQHLSRCKISAKYLACLHWKENLRLELQFASLPIVRTSKEIRLEKALWLMHQMDPYGSGLLPFLNRKFRATSVSKKTKSRYVDMPLSTQSMLASLAAIYNANSYAVDKTIIDLSYNALDIYDYQYCLDQDELILNLRWSLYGDVRIVNPLSYWKEQFLQKKHKLTTGYYDYDKLQQIANLLYNSVFRHKSSIQAPNFESAVQRLYAACTEKVIVDDLAMMPYIIRRSGNQHYWGYDVYQFSEEKGSFIKITDKLVVQKVVLEEMKKEYA